MPPTDNSPEASSHRDAHQRQRGFALLVVLWTVVLLSLMAGAFAREWRAQTRIAGAATRAAEAQAAAEAGLNYAIAWLNTPDATQRPAADGTPTAIDLAGAHLTIRIEDERGKIDLNRSGLEMVRELLTNLGRSQDESDALLDAIADYRDNDHAVRPNGAEDDDYRAKGLLHGAKDAPFESVEELRQVYGMTDDLFAQMRPALTVYNTSRRIVPAAAPPLVRQSLNMIVPEDQGSPDEPIIRTASRGTFTVLVDAETPGGGRFERRAVVRITGSRRVPYQLFEFDTGHAPPPAPQQP